MKAVTFCWFWSVLILLDTTTCSNGEKKDGSTIAPPGHNLPFGSHTTPFEVPVVDKFPTPNVFFEEYMHKSRPLVIRSILNLTTFPAVVKWTDDFFRKEVGEEYIDAEPARKENRNLTPEQMTMRSFLQQYAERELYLVSGIEVFRAKDKLMDDLYVPRSLHCGGLQFLIESLVMWFSSGGTKSVLHNDDYENFNCVLDGTKELVFVDTKHREQVQADGYHEDGSYSDVDVDKVDMHKFPRLGEVPVYKAVLHKGDCLYIPYQWYHQVNSPGGRSLAINFWFLPTRWFNTSDCQDKNLQHQTQPSSKFDIGQNQMQAWNKFTWSFQENETSKAKYKEAISTNFPKSQFLQDELFKDLDKDGSLSLSLEELYNVDINKILQKYSSLDAALTAEDITHDEL
ncbi:bifunctional peptidase and (3S)-lysyl hydroxylase JMJD7-like [Haliotis rufescens]|uniref:bifunctional peptidase and (3S)-lysyl hydroxylase JMJD7-like n=1 Tax=Haliotis rufescens TaxID=6454 RepID=UPI00201F2D9A|nr:bifunctional peptidase and (3S)-lysyl hydroxylase JMJD7-like [Haliotis rufescens]